MINSEYLRQCPKVIMPVKPLVLSIRGPLGSGKTTAANYFTTSYANAVKISFADPLKEEVFEALFYGKIPQQVEEALGESYGDFERNNLFANDLKPYGVFSEWSVSDKLAWVNNRKVLLRELLQYWATEYRRAQDQNYWVNQLLGKARSALNEGKVVIVDDARFPNERKALFEELGAYEVFLYTPDSDALQAKRDGTTAKGLAGHESERYNDPNDPNIDFTITNTPPVENLYRQLEHIVRDCIKSQFNETNRKRVY